MQFQRITDQIELLAEIVRQETESACDLWQSLPYQSARALSCNIHEDENFFVVMKYKLWPVGDGRRADVFVDCSSGRLVYRDGMTTASNDSLMKCYAHWDSCLNARVLHERIEKYLRSPRALRDEQSDNKLAQFVRMFQVQETHTGDPLPIAPKSYEKE